MNRTPPLPCLALPCTCVSRPLQLQKTVWNSECECWPTQMSVFCYYFFMRDWSWSAFVRLLNGQNTRRQAASIEFKRKIKDGRYGGRKEGTARCWFGRVSWTAVGPLIIGARRAQSTPMWPPAMVLFSLFYSFLCASRREKIQITGLSGCNRKRKNQASSSSCCGSDAEHDSITRFPPSRIVCPFIDSL